MRRTIILVVVAAAMIVTAAPAARFHPATVRPTVRAKKRCHVVRKIVHHHRKRVRVCTKPKPPPPPPPPPAPPPPPQAAVVAGSVTPSSEPIDSIAVGDGAIWAVIGKGTTIVRIDPAAMKVVATVTNPFGTEWPARIAVGLGAVWLSDATTLVGDERAGGQLVRVDEQTNSVVATIPVGRSPEGIAFAGGDVWTADHRSDDALSAPPPHTFSVSRVDPVANRETARIVIEHRPATSDQWGSFCCGPQGLAAAAGSVWVGDTTPHTVSRIDPATNKVVATVPAPAADSDACGPLAGDDNAVWVASGCDASTIWRIDPAANASVASITVPGVSGDIALGFGSVWATTNAYQYGGGTDALVRIDPATNTIVGQTEVPGIGAIAVGEGAIWAVQDKTVLKLEPVAASG